MDVYLCKMTKKYRQQQIEEIISKDKIRNQDELLIKLQKLGFELTQATLSRDIKEMKIIKVPNQNGEYIYQLSENVKKNEENGSAITAYGFLNIEFSGNLAVIKTRPGYAMGIASEIDNKATSTILGTVAGDDTILIIPRENISRQKILEGLSLFIPIIK